jgi:RNA polymerase sigma-54 factor
MIRNKQQLSQKQTLQQKLSPQQLQYIKLLQLPTLALEQRIKEELELNPVLEEIQETELIQERLDESEIEAEADKESESEKEEEDLGVDALDEHDVDWDDFEENTEFDGELYSSTPVHPDAEEWRELPNPYEESLLEKLEEQVALLDFSDEESLIADQILGSLDEDGYFRRDFEAVVDNIAFNHGVLITADDVDRIRKKIQLLDPIGIASTDLRDCLLVQLEHASKDLSGRNVAINMIRNEWDAFEKKHFSKLLQRLNVSEKHLKQAFDAVTHMDPRPGAVSTQSEESNQYIEPDFEVYWEQSDLEDDEKGFFNIRLNHRNSPSLRISPQYESMWEEIKAKKEKNPERKETQTFIKNKMDSAQWFLESIRQRQNTLMATMKTIVALQEDFFKFGDGLKPMILKDVAERIGMDISTVSRVVNGKYVQTSFGIYELKYFFNEGLETESGEEVSNREVKNTLEEIIKSENKQKPYSDQELAEKLKEKGYKVARRTI